MRSKLAKSTQTAVAAGEQADGTGEAECLAAEANAVLQLASKAVSASSASGRAVPEGAVWLGPTAGYSDDAAMVQSLLSLHRSSPTSRSSPSKGPAFSYKMTTEMGAEGWAQARDAENLAGLERRVQFLQAQIAADPSTESGSLSSSVGTLERRLTVLQQACSEKACNKLLTSIQCIASDLEQAIHEVQRCMKLEAEERALAAEGEVGATVEDVSAQIAKLHSEALQSRTPLRAVSARVSEVDNMLSAGEVAHKQLQHFAEDLTAVEARFAWTKTLLEETVAATMQMKASATENRERMTRNLTSLEAKLLARQSKR